MPSIVTARRAIEPLLGVEKARSVPFDRTTEIPAFKAAGHFNDDWETARGVALLLYLRARGEAPPLNEFLGKAEGRGVKRLFEHYPDVKLPQESISLGCSGFAVPRLRSGQAPAGGVRLQADPTTLCGVRLQPDQTV